MMDTLSPRTTIHSTQPHDTALGYFRLGHDNRQLAAMRCLQAQTHLRLGLAAHLRYVEGCWHGTLQHHKSWELVVIAGQVRVQIMGA